MYQAGDLGSTWCGFDISLSFGLQKRFDTITFAPDGTLTIKETGVGVHVFTNVATGKTLAYDVNGVFTFVVHPDGTLDGVVEGPFAYLAFPQDQAGFGVPGLALATGHTTFHNDQDGFLTAWSNSGTVVDGCAALR